MATCRCGDTAMLIETEPCRLGYIDENVSIWYSKNFDILTYLRNKTFVCFLFVLINSWIFILISVGKVDPSRSLNDYRTVTYVDNSDMLKFPLQYIEHIDILV